MKIQGKTFLVTGGGSGLGKATAGIIAQAGGLVVVADIDESAGNAAQAEIGSSALFVAADVTDPTSVTNALDRAESHFGRVRGVVNCAGIAIAEKTVGRDGPHGLESFERVIRINLLGSFNVIRLAAARLVENEPDKEGERGVVVNTASVAAFDGQIGQAAYSASKGGIVGMTLPIARDLARYGVRVMTIAPGIFDTPLLAALPEQVRLSLGQQVPFPPRLGRPEEYGFLVTHVIENTMLNGEVIRLDGAIRMPPR